MRSILRGRRWPSLTTLWEIGSTKHRASTHVIVVFLLLAFLSPCWIAKISGEGIRGDAHHNVVLALNVANHGAFSSAEKSNPSGEYAPSRKREPLPPAVNALYLRVLQYFEGPMELDSLINGPNTRFLKLSNLFWGALVTIAVYAAVNIFTGSMLLSVIGAAFAASQIEVDRLYTEPPGQALLALFSLFSLLMIRSTHPIYFCAAGLSLGALILTKASFLYIAPILALTLLAFYAWQKFQGNLPRRVVAGCFILITSAAVLVAPWSARNYYYFGSPGLAERGGAVLYIRALKNEMTWTEYLGAIYAWNPYTEMRTPLGEILGFSRTDLEKGGSLQRLNRSLPEDIDFEKAGRPEEAISYYRKARAERTRLTRVFKGQGNPDPSGAADDTLQKLSVEKILERPIAHFSMIPLFIWRGGALTLLLVSLGLALGLKGEARTAILAYATPSMAMVAFLGLATHYIPRYSDPAMPILVVLTTVLLYHVSVAVLRFSMRLWQENLMTPLPSTATRSTEPGPAINASTSGH